MFTIYFYLLVIIKTSKRCEFEGIPVCNRRCCV